MNSLILMLRKEGPELTDEVDIVIGRPRDPGENNIFMWDGMSSTVYDILDHIIFSILLPDSVYHVSPVGESKEVYHKCIPILCKQEGNIRIFYKTRRFLSPP